MSKEKIPSSMADASPEEIQKLDGEMGALRDEVQQEEEDLGDLDRLHRIHWVSKGFSSLGPYESYRALYREWMDRFGTKTLEQIESLAKADISWEENVAGFSAWVQLKEGAKKGDIIN